MLRIRAILRRRQRELDAPSALEVGVLRYADLELDEEAHEGSGPDS